MATVGDAMIPARVFDLREAAVALLDSGYAVAGAVVVIALIGVLLAAV